MHVQVAHVDVASNSLLDVRQWSQREAQEELGGMADLQGCWQPVESLLKHLQALPHGHYLLSFVPASGCICILKAWAGLISPQVSYRVASLRADQWGCKLTADMMTILEASTWDPGVAIHVSWHMRLMG